MTPRSRSAIELVAAMAIGSLAIVLAKETLTKVPFTSFLWAQMLVAMVAMLSYTLVFKREAIPKKVIPKEWILVALIGLLNFTIVRFIFIYALELIPVTTHAYIMNFVGIVTMFLSIILLKERPFKLQVLGALVAIVGLWLYFYESQPTEQINGILWLSFAVFCLALTNICMRLLYLIDGALLSSNQVTTLATVIGGLPIIMYGITTELSLASIDHMDWIIIIINGLFAVALPVIVFVRVLEHLKAYEASVLATTSVIFTAIFAIPILNDYLTSFEFWGMLLMLIGLYLVQKEKFFIR